MRQITRAEYLLRHLRTIAPYVTVTKILNLALNVVELKLNIPCARSLPPFAKVETTPDCQMACPGCHHGSREKKKELMVRREQLRLEDFKRIIEPIHRTTLGISLSLRGEPLLGKDLIPIIEHAHSKNIAVSFPSNLSVKLSDEKITRLVRSGVDAIYVSLDGASQESYAKYRVGGDFHRVLHNVRAIAQTKERLRLSRPHLVWKFVVFGHNKHEIPIVAAEFRRLGFDAYELVQDYTSKQAHNGKDRHVAELVRKRKGCYWAWHTSIIRADGIVTPCCLGQRHDFGLGNALSQSFRDIWRGHPYTQLRRGFQTMAPEALHPVCAKCLGVETHGLTQQQASHNTAH
jgi:MoaA/NifB/PqqE/SkfB family radical SAM enzyme